MDFSIPDELKQIKAKVRQMVDTELKPHDQAIEESRHIPPQALEAIREIGLFGTLIPSEYGGLGHGMLGNCLVIAEMAEAHIAYFYTYSMSVQIASKGIELYGSAEPRRRWLMNDRGRRVVKLSKRKKCRKIKGFR
jgi:acyl-CoA dehydrogenase